MKKELARAGKIAAWGTAIMPGLGTAPGLIYGAYVLGKPLAKWMDKSVTEATKKTVERARRERERKREEERIRNLPPPPPVPPAPTPPTAEELVKRAEDRLNRKVELWRNATGITERLRRMKIQDAQEEYLEEVDAIQNQ